MMRGPVFGPRFGGPMMMLGPKPFYGGVDIAEMNVVAYFD